MHRRFSALLFLLIPLLAYAQQAPVPLNRPAHLGGGSSLDAATIQSMAAEDEGVFNGPFKQTQDPDSRDWPQEVFIDPDLSAVRITREPGQSWDDCHANPKVCLTIADSSTVLARELSEEPLERQEINLATGELETVRYMHVIFRDKQGKVQDGWIEMSALRRTKLAPIYSAPKPSDPPVAPEVPCPEDQPPMPVTDEMSDLADVSRAVQKSAQEQLADATEAVRPFVGKCPLSPPNEKDLNEWGDGKNIYDVEALPLIKGHKGPLPKVLREAPGGRTEVREMTIEDMTSIDALARTMYSEMNGCFKNGIQFPMAVAKVAVNRTRLYEEDKAPAHFLQPPHESNKSSLAKVLTSPYQFSVWNLSSAKNPNDKTSLMSLCPMREVDSRENWKGKQASPEEVQIWDLALKIATEAVLFPRSFEQKTSEVTQYYYTSGKETNKEGRRRATPAPNIQGRAVNSLKCMYLWEGT